LFEVGDSGLFVDFSFALLRIWDFGGEGELLFETNCTLKLWTQLKNGNILSLYTYGGGETRVEELQVVR